MTNLSQQLAKAKKNHKLASSKGLDKKALYWKTYESKLSEKEELITSGKIDLNEAMKESAAEAKDVVEAGEENLDKVESTQETETVSPAVENYPDLNENFFANARNRVSDAWSAAGKKVRNFGRSIKYKTQVSMRAIKRWFASFGVVPKDAKREMSQEAVFAAMDKMSLDFENLTSDFERSGWENFKEGFAVGRKMSKLSKKIYADMLSQAVDNYLIEWDEKNPQIEEPQYENWVRDTYNKVTSGIGKFVRNAGRGGAYVAKKAISDIKFFYLAKFVVSQKELDKIEDDIMNSSDYHREFEDAMYTWNNADHKDDRIFVELTAKYVMKVMDAQTDYINSILDRAKAPVRPQYESADLDLLTESVFDYIVDSATSTSSRQLDNAAKRFAVMNEDERSTLCEAAAGLYADRLANEEADINETLALISAEVASHVLGMPSEMFESQYDKMIADPQGKPQSTTVEVEESDAGEDKIEGKTESASTPKQVAQKLDELWDEADAAGNEAVKPFLESMIQSIVRGNRLMKNGSITFTELMEQTLKAAEPFREAAMLEAAEIGVKAEDVVKEAPKTEGSKIKDKGLIDKHDKASTEAVTAEGKKKEETPPGALLDPEMQPPGGSGDVSEGIRGVVNAFKGGRAAERDLNGNSLSKEEKQKRKDHVAELSKKQAEKEKAAKGKGKNAVRLESQYGGALGIYGKAYIGGRLTKAQFNSKLSAKRKELTEKYSNMNESLSPLERLVLEAEGRKLEKQKSEIATKYPFFESLSDSGKEKFMNMSEAEKTGASNEIMSSYWNMNPVKMEKILESAEEKYGAYAFISTIPQRLVPIWEALDNETRSGIAGLYRLQNIQSTYESQIFWETTLRTDLIGNKGKKAASGLVNLNEDLDISNTTAPTYNGVSHLGYSSDFVDSIF